MNKILGKFLLTLLLWIPVMAMSTVDILVSTDRNPVHIDEAFQLTFESNGSVDDDPDFSPLKVLLDVIRQSENSSISIINGTMSRNKTWTLTVMAKSLGDIQIPSIHFGDDRSPSLLIKVNKADQAQSGNDSFFVNLSSDVTSNVEQAQIIVTVRVFSDKSLNEISLSSLQFNHGDVVVEVLGDEKSYQTKIQGRPYLVIEQKMALFPQKPGPLIVQPVLALGSVRNGARTFFGDPSSKPVRARSKVLNLEVTAKPKSTGLWLPAKSLILSDQWLSDPSQFTVGEPITRVLTLTAEGLTAAQLPELDIKNIDTIKMYPDKKLLKNGLTALGVSGIRQEKIAYIPSQVGTITLPAMIIPWWNTDTKQWQEAKIVEQVITVKASQNFVEQAPVVTQEKTSEVAKVEVMTLAAQNPQTLMLGVEAWWKWLAIVFALAWLVTLYLYVNKSAAKQIKEKIEKTKAPVFEMQKLKKACQNQDEAACKRALIDWANARFYDQVFTQLSEISPLVKEELQQNITKLEAVLYASEKNKDWQPDALYQAVLTENKIIRANVEEQAPSLKPFNLR